MKHTVNWLLFVLVVVSILAMTGMALYYKKTYDDLSVRYQSAQGEVFAAAEQLNRTITEVNAKEEMLNEKERVLNTYMSELNLSKERETSLGAHFTDLKKMNTQLETNLSSTTTDRNRWKTSYDTTKKDLDVCKVDYEVEKSESEERLEEILRVRSLKLGMETAVDRAVDSEGDANAKADDIAGTAGEIKSLAAGINDTTLKNQITSKADDIKNKATSLEDLLDKLLENLASLKYLIGQI